MKKVVFLKLILIFCLASCEKGYKNLDCLPPNLSDSVIALYPFSNGSLTDFSSNNNNLTNFKATLAEDRLGTPNCAYRFSRSFNSFMEGNGRFSNNFHKEEFSISLWYKAEGFRGGGDLEGLVERMDTLSGKLPNWSVSLGDCRVPQFGLVGRYIRDNKPPIIHCDSLGMILTDSWFHIVVTFNGSVQKIYKNGVKSTLVQDKDPFGPALTNEGSLFIGYKYTGILDDIIIFNRELTVDEVIELYNLDPCCEE